MRYFYFSSLLLFSIIITSCNKTLQEEKVYAEEKNIESYINQKSWKYTKVNNVYHVSRVSSYGYQVAKGDTIKFWFKGYTLDNKVFDTNIKSEAITNDLDTTTHFLDPIVTTAGIGNLVKGLDLGMLQLTEGEEATLLFPSSLGFGNDAIGPIKNWSTLAYDINLISVSNPLIREERDLISKLNLESSGFTKDISGLYLKYIILGAGSSPTINDTIYGWYKGTLLDGTIIEDLGGGNQTIVLSRNDIPMGVRLGFTVTQVGGSTDLTFASFLGYGNDGQNVVKPYQTLRYQIRLDSIK